MQELVSQVDVAEERVVAAQPHIVGKGVAAQERRSSLECFEAVMAHGRWRVALHHGSCDAALVQEDMPVYHDAIGKWSVAAHDHRRCFQLFPRNERPPGVVSFCQQQIPYCIAVLHEARVTSNVFLKQLL